MKIDPSKAISDFHGALFVSKIAKGWSLIFDSLWLGTLENKLYHFEQSLSLVLENVRTDWIL